MESIEQQINTALESDITGTVWAKYKAHDGLRYGQILQQAVTSTTGVQFVFIDSFANRVRVSDIVEINPRA